MAASRPLIQTVRPIRFSARAAVYISSMHLAHPAEDRACEIIACARLHHGGLIRAWGFVKPALGDGIVALGLCACFQVGGPVVGWEAEEAAVGVHLCHVGWRAPGLKIVDLHLLWVRCEVVCGTARRACPVWVFVVGLVLVCAPTGCGSVSACLGVPSGAENTNEKGKSNLELHIAEYREDHRTEVVSRGLE